MIQDIQKHAKLNNTWFRVLEKQWSDKCKTQKSGYHGGSMNRVKEDGEVHTGAIFLKLCIGNMQECLIYTILYT